MILSVDDFKLMLEYYELPSNFQIDDDVTFVPMYRQQQNMGIDDEPRWGKIVNVKFTKAKVFYDILDDYYGIIFDGVDSCKVWKEKLLELPIVTDDDVPDKQLI